MRLDTQAILRASQDERELSHLIEENKGSILREASVACRRYITEADDEWSVALTAYVQAVREYAPSKGSFPSFSRLIIRRRLIDYYRSQQKFDIEIPATPSFYGESGDEETPNPVSLAVTEKLSYVAAEDNLKGEIQGANEIFKEYGFTFFELSTCSPKAEKTRAACAKCVRYLLVNPPLLKEMRDSKLLPIKKIEKNAGVPRKLLERHRKYIIAAAEILSGDYPGLAAYLRFVKEEGYG